MGHHLTPLKMLIVIAITVSKMTSHCTLHSHCTNEGRVRKCDKKVRCDLRRQQRQGAAVTCDAAAVTCDGRLFHLAAEFAIWLLIYQSVKLFYVQGAPENLFCIAVVVVII